MAETPLVSQDRPPASVPGRVGDNHAEGRSAVSAPAHHGASRPAVRQPRFAITAGKLREAFLHRLKWAVSAGLILACAGAVLAWVTYQPKYTATATLRMFSNASRILQGTSNEHPQTQEESRQTWAYWIKSRDVINAALASPKIRALNTVRALEDPDVWLEKDLQAKFVTAEYCRIALSGENPKDITEIVNEVMDVFVQHFVAYRDGQLNDRIDKIDKALEIEQQKVGELRKKFMLEVETSGSADPRLLTFSQRAVIEELGALKAEMLKLQSEIRLKRVILVRLRSVLEQENKKGQEKRKEQKGSKEPRSVKEPELSKEPEPLTEPDALSKEQEVLKEESHRDQENEKTQIERYLERHPQVQKARSEIAELENKIKTISKIVNSDNPRLRDYQNAVKQAHDRLEKTKSDLFVEAREEARVSLKDARERAMRATESSLKMSEDLYDDIFKKAEKVGREAALFSKGSIHAELLLRELEQADSVAKNLRQQKEMLKVETYNTDKSLGQVLDVKDEIKIKAKAYFSQIRKADEPTVNQASLLKTGGIYSVAGLLLGLFGVSYLEARVRRVHSPADIHHELGIETLGVLPILAKEGRAYGHAVDQSPPGLMFTEAVNSLCASLLCDDRLSRSAVLMVTSAREHEGKTLLATQLAVGLARTGRKTLLLDCDFRNPRCHQQLGLAAGPGLSEVLRGEAELASALQTMPESEARMLSAGQTDPQITKALSNGDFAALLTRLRQDFDCIIVDSAPTLVVADGLLIGKLADGVILVVRPKVSKAPAVFSAYEQLTSLKIRILGAVVNANPNRASSSYYARY